MSILTPLSSSDRTVLNCQKPPSLSNYVRIIQCSAFTKDVCNLIVNDPKNVLGRFHLLDVKTSNVLQLILILFGKTVQRQTLVTFGMKPMLGIWISQKSWHMRTYILLPRLNSVHKYLLCFFPFRCIKPTGPGICLLSWNHKKDGQGHIQLCSYCSIEMKVK